MRMPSPELKCARGASSGTASPPSPKCSRIIAALAWKPPQARTTASAGSVSPLARRTPAMAPFSVISASAAQPKRNTTPASRAARVSSRWMVSPPPTGWMRGGPFAR